ncbi:MAG: diacylglycerol kinase family lipid kinase [bacterium]|nr:diacylglycerol kinase family lipid kinase [bacterium]
MTRLSKTLLLANPTSQNGNGAKSASLAEQLLRPVLGDDLEVVFTESSGHAQRLAAKSSGYDTVIALGGDGIVHEIVCGLMELEKAERPTFALIPAGSGNDYARSLGVHTDVRGAVETILRAEAREVDVGCCNGEPFAETLSFGLDAAIAIDTVERRKRTSKTETALYFEAGIDQLLHHLDTYEFEISLDGAPPFKGDMIMFAIQNGITYGGGFKICPEAKLDDGIFNICWAEGGFGVVKAIMTFAKAKNGKHVNNKRVHFATASNIHIEFDRCPPCQMDGEGRIAQVFDVSVLRRALSVIGNWSE